MTLRDICDHERSGMFTRQLYALEGDQHDQHLWCWLVEMLAEWGEANPIRVSP